MKLQAMCEKDKGAEGGQQTNNFITWIEPMVVINSQPWGIVYWLAFKRLPVQTTDLFLQAFLKYFYSQEMLTLEIKLHLILTLSVELQTIMTFYEKNYGQNEFNL